MINYYCMLEMPQDIDQEALKEISRKTDMVSGIIGGIVLVVFLMLVIYLIYFYKTTKRPTRSTTRFKNYMTASGKITEVEMVSYFVKPYEEKKQEPDTDSDHHNLAYEIIHKDLREYNMYDGTYINQSIRREDYNDALNRIRKSMDDTQEKKKEIEKIRFKVRYEFSTDSSNLYSGECFVYEKNDDIAVGKYIEVKYNPENPLNNFTKYSNPVGVF